METWQIVLLALVIFCILWIVGTVIFAAVVNRRHAPIGKFVECNGVRLHLLERGKDNSPVLVFLHGNGMMIQDLVISGLLESAAKHYRVLCFDRPGFGHSTRPRRVWTPQAEAQLFAAALNQLGVRQAIIVGHSWGTLVSIALGLQSPELVQGLVIASGYYFPTTRKDVWLLSVPAIPILGDLLRYTISPVFSWFLLPKLIRTMFAPRSVPPRFAREFPMSMTVRPLQLRAAAEETAMMIPSAASLQGRYAGLTCAVAMIVGDKDQVVNPDQTSRLHSILSQSSVRMVREAGHMVHHAAPDEFIKAIRSLLSPKPPDFRTIATERSEKPIELPAKPRRRRSARRNSGALPQYLIKTGRLANRRGVLSESVRQPEGRAHVADPIHPGFDSDQRTGTLPPSQTGNKNLHFRAEAKTIVTHDSPSALSASMIANRAESERPKIIA
jgi:pimeloyl-ACP methyl ester carboxylesterase